MPGVLLQAEDSDQDRFYAGIYYRDQSGGRQFTVVNSRKYVVVLGKLTKSVHQLVQKCG